MAKSDLAYQKNATVNWDPVDQTAYNEQVVDGKGWRSGALVERREIKQWFLKITEYADALLEGTKYLEQWPSQVRQMQANWIGKSFGLDISFAVENSDNRVSVFTTRGDTLFGASAIVVAPTHPLAQNAATQNPSLSKTLESLSTSGVSEAEIEKQDKRGVSLGQYAICPISGRRIPIWAGNYVLMDYGHGAIMLVPAHCERDHQFAKRYDLEVLPVIAKEHDYDQSAMLEKGVLINSNQYNGLKSEEAIQKLDMTYQKKDSNFVQNMTTTVFTSTLLGMPIPIIHCDDCGIVPEKEENCL